MNASFSFFLFMALMSLSCAPREKATSVVLTGADTTARQMVRVSAQPEKPDTTSRLLKYPANDHDFTVEIIPTGFFHGDEVWDGIEKDSLTGLFLKDGAYYVDAASVIAKASHDAIVDDEGDTNGVELMTKNQDVCLLLMRGAGIKYSRTVPHVDLAIKEIYPGDTVAFDFLGAQYKLFATGEKKGVPGIYSCTNYQLFLSRTDRQQTQRLVAHPAYDDAMTSILFLGDIDGDNVLDLIIDTTHHYNASMPTLYLSRPADKSEIIKIVGRHVSVGC